MLQDEKLNSTEKAVQRKLDSGRALSHDDKKVIQARLSRVLQRRGTTIPGPVVSSAGDPDAVLNKLNSMAQGMWRNAPDFHGTSVESTVQGMLGSSTLPRKSGSFFFANTSGINMNWSGQISLTVENPHSTSAGTGSNALGGGGSATTNTGQSSSTTDSASATGSVTPGKDGGAGGSATAGTSTTTGTTSGTADTSNGTTTHTSNDSLQRYSGTLVANLSLRAEMPMSGSDYVNPFKWGMAIGQEIAPIAPRSDSVNCGTVEYQVSSGFAAAAPPAAH
jgi:hypothetical protein